MSFAFLLTTLVVVVTPGAGVLYTLATGLSGGRRASVLAAIGCTLGIVPHLTATLTGLAALLSASTMAFETVRYLGVAYLLVMAWTTLREKDAIVLDARPATRSAPRTIGAGIAVNLVNPKLTLFFVAFLPQFVRSGEPGALLGMLELSAVFMGVTLVVFVAYGLLAAAVRTHVIGRPRVTAWLRRIFAGSFVGLAMTLAFTA
jgi:threonine/homoserine/homoserine lactone efflux protein